MGCSLCFPSLRFRVLEKPRTNFTGEGVGEAPVDVDDKRSFKSLLPTREVAGRIVYSVTGVESGKSSLESRSIEPRHSPAGGHGELCPRQRRRCPRLWV